MFYLSSIDRSWGEKLGLAIASLCAIAFSTNSANAQITADDTLPNNSRVITQDNLTTIEAGTIQGSNLFHSFKDFSVPTGSTADFNNAPDIQNIISRVTGGSSSNIDGLIRANGTANLFLLNPNGIIFGPNAQLNIRGSFLASTANSLKFADGIEFSATTPQTKPLLTVSVPIGLQYGANPERILVQGNGQGYRITPELIDTDFGLRVPANQTLALVGGDVVLEGATLKTAGGRIELGSVASPGLVRLTPSQKGFSLSYEGVSTFGDIQLSQQSAVDASGEGAGDIQVRGKRVTLTDLSSIETSTLRAEPGGTLTVTASDSVELSDSAANGLASGLFALVYSGATGTGADIVINTGRLILQDGTLVTTVTMSESAAGNLTVRASESLELYGGPFASVLITSSYPGASGAAGNIFIETGQLILQGLANVTADTYGKGQGGNIKIDTRRLIARDGGQIKSATFSEGQAGNVLVRASDSVELIGTLANDGGIGSGLSTASATNATGSGGNLTIETGQLIVQDGAFITSGTLGAGAGGNLEVEARDSIELRGTSADGQSSSILTAETRGTGSAGNLTIKTRQLAIRDGALVSTSTSSDGSGGNLEVEVGDSMELNGTSDDGQYFSSLITRTTGKGNAGNLTIKTGQLTVKDGAIVSAATFSEGQAGTLAVNASKLVELIGTSADDRVASGLSTSTEPGATGAGGNLIVDTPQLIVRDGAQIGAGTFSEGRAGNLTVNASESVELIGTSAGSDPSALFTSVAPQSTGTGGNLNVETSRLIVRDGAQIGAGTFGAGSAGSLTVRASKSVELLGENPSNGEASALFTLVGSKATGAGGKLTIETGRLIVRDGAVGSAATFGAGVGGILTVIASELVELSGISGVTGESGGLVTAANSTGDAGDLTIKTGQLLLRDGAQASVGSQGSGIAGNLQVEARSIQLDNQSKLRAESTSGNGGNIKLQAQDLLLLRRNSNISTSAGTAQAGGNGGNITIDSPFIVAVPSENSDITANAFSGSGGTVAINATNIFGMAVRSREDLVRLLSTNDPIQLDTQKLLTSDISAISQASPTLSGQVNINTPDVDPSRGLAELPAEVVDASGLIAQGCAAQNGKIASQFTITGRGGLPPNPSELLSSDAVWQDARRPSVMANRQNLKTATQPSEASAGVEIVPATSWKFNNKGEVVLIAQAVNTPQTFTSNSTTCRVP